MENIGINNFISIIVGISLILSCCIISYLFQKHLFGKYRNKVKNIVGKNDKPIS